MSLNEVSLRIPTEHMAIVFGQFDQLKIIGTPSAASGAQEVFELLYELAKR